MSVYYQMKQVAILTLFVQSDIQIDRDQFSIEIRQIQIKVKKFQSLSFPFPTGNEIDHTE